MRLLFAEDDLALCRAEKTILESAGYSVDFVHNGEDALDYAQAAEYDGIILDWMMPAPDGVEVLRRLRAKGIATPCLLLTARDAVEDRVAGLDAGAVDYVTKPFAIEELLARIRVALKLHAPAEPSSASRQMEERGGVLRWGQLTLDEARHQVRYGGQEITLTGREFLMLKTLLENQDIVLSRDTLLNRVCGYDFVGETNIVDVYIRYLRSKIDDVFRVKVIQTVGGVGYVIKYEEG